MRARLLAAVWQRCRPHLLFLAIVVLFVLSIVVAGKTAAADIPDWCIRGIAAVETNTTWRDIGDLTYRDRRQGADGEVGPWQISPDALRDLGVSHLMTRIHREPVLAESMTRAWLLRCYRTTGDWFDAVAIYHTGPSGDRRRGLNYAERVRAAGGN
jgi:hypothetical protein